MLEIGLIGIFTGVLLRLGVIGNKIKAVNYVTGGMIVAFALASKIASYFGGVTFATHATTVMYFFIFALGGLLVTEGALFFSKHGQKIGKAI